MCAHMHTQQDEERAMGGMAHVSAGNALAIHSDIKKKSNPIVSQGFFCVRVRKSKKEVMDGGGVVVVSVQLPRSW